MPGLAAGRAVIHCRWRPLHPAGPPQVLTSGHQHGSSPQRQPALRRRMPLQLAADAGANGGMTGAVDAAVQRITDAAQNTAETAQNSVSTDSSGNVSGRSDAAAEAREAAAEARKAAADARDLLNGNGGFLDWLKSKAGGRKQAATAKQKQEQLEQKRSPMLVKAVEGLQQHEHAMRANFGSSSDAANGSGGGRDSDGDGATESALDKAKQGVQKVTSVLGTSASGGGSNLLRTAGSGLATLGEKLQQAAPGGGGGASDSSANAKEMPDAAAPGDGPGGVRGFLLAAERHRLPALMLAVLLAGCLRPQWGAAVYSLGGGPPLQASLLAVVFFLYGLNFGRTALSAGDALSAWARLAGQQIGIFWHRHVHPRSDMGADFKELKLHAKTSALALQGVETRRGEAAKALLSWPAASWGAAASLLFSPLVALAVKPLLRGVTAAPGLALGLAAWFCMPPTLSRALALTQRAGGNVAFALLLAVGTNLLALCTLPLLAPPLLGPLLPSPGFGATVTGPSPPLILCCLVRLCVAPLGAGIAARTCFCGVAQFVDAHPRAFSWAATAALAAAAWVTIARGLADAGAATVAPRQLALVFGIAAAAHGLFIAGNLLVVRRFRLGGNNEPESYIFEGSAFDEEAHAAQAVAVERTAALVAAQKTLPTTLALLGILVTSGGAGLRGTLLWLATGGASAGGGGGVLGASAAAAVTAHLAQSAVDLAATAAWRRQNQREDKLARAAKGQPADDHGLATA